MKLIYVFVSPRTGSLSDLKGKNVKTSEILSDTWNFGLIDQYT